MIAAARRQRRHHQYLLIRGKAQSIPLGTGAADAIVSVFPGPYIRDPATEREITRVLAPDGTVVVAIGAELAANGRRRRLRRLALRLFYGQWESRLTAEFRLPNVPGKCHRLPTEHGAVILYIGKRGSVAAVVPRSP
jgi:SAM-dependent methyltransferase